MTQQVHLSLLGATAVRSAKTACLNYSDTKPIIQRKGTSGKIARYSGAQAELCDGHEK